MAASELIVPAIGILGTIAGTALGGGLTYRTEQARAAIEDRRQWREQRLKAYVSLLQATAEQVRLSPSYAGKELEAQIVKGKGDDLSKELTDELAEREKPGQLARQALAEAELLATGPTAEAARRLVAAADSYNDAAFEVHKLYSKIKSNQEQVDEDDDIDRGAWGRAKRTEAAARSDFCAEARRELGIVGTLATDQVAAARTWGFSAGMRQSRAHRRSAREGLDGAGGGDRR